MMVITLASWSRYSSSSRREVCGDADSIRTASSTTGRKPSSPRTTSSWSSTCFRKMYVLRAVLLEIVGDWPSRSKSTECKLLFVASCVRYSSAGELSVSTAEAVVLTTPTSKVAEAELHDDALP